jgi:DHA1 family inner membrane transport protein
MEFAPGRRQQENPGRAILPGFVFSGLIMQEATHLDSNLPTITAPRGAGMAELALAIGGLAIGTGEFASMSILPLVAQDLGTTLPDMGHMISAYALGVVIGAPLITIFMARMPRRMMLMLLMLMYAVGPKLGALAPPPGLLILARFVAGIPHGAYFGVAALVAAALVTPDRRAQAVGRVMLGLTVANIFGVPLATWLGQVMGWRSAFAIVGALALLTVAMVFVFLPFIAAGNSSIRGELGVFRRLQVWLTLLMVAIGFGGMFAMYTYVTPTLQQLTHASPLEISVLLGMIGVGMTVGSLAGGWFADRNQTATIFGVLIWESLVLAAFAWTSSNLWLAGLNLFLIGTGIAVVPAVQTRLMDVAGDAQTVAAALNHSAFNIANALGAWAGGLTIAAGYGLQSTALVGALLPLGGIVVLGISRAVDRRDGARAAVPAA